METGNLEALAAAGAMSLVSALALWRGLLPSPGPPPSVRHVQVPTPLLSLPSVCSIAISPDGSRLARVGET